MTATYNKINSFVEAVAEKKHNLGSDTLKVMLSNTAPIASNTVKADLVDLAQGTAGGYTAGGTAITITTSAQTSGTYKLVGNAVVFTASGGTIGAFRYVAVYNDTAANDELICWYDYGSSITLADSETFTVNFDQSSGIFTIA